MPRFLGAHNGPRRRSNAEAAMLDGHREKEDSEDARRRCCRCARIISRQQFNRGQPDSKIEVNVRAFHTFVVGGYQMCSSRKKALLGANINIDDIITMYCLGFLRSLAREMTLLLHEFRYHQIISHFDSSRAKYFCASRCTFIFIILDMLKTCPHDSA